MVKFCSNGQWKAVIYLNFWAEEIILDNDNCLT